MSTKSAPQAARLVLLSPKTGKPMQFRSRMMPHPDGSFSFLVGSFATGERYRVTVRVEEVRNESERPSH